MSKINVAVLRGGPSSLYETSLASGSAVLEFLPSDKFNAVDILIDKNARWHLKGLPKDPAFILEKFDVAFNTLHGEYGQDGQVQSILELSGIPFTGPKAFDASVSFHKVLSRRILSAAETGAVKIQKQFFINSLDLVDASAEELAQDIFSQIPPPYVLRPVKYSAEFDTTSAGTKSELANLIEKMTMEFDEVVVESFVFGREISVSLIKEFRGEGVYLSPPMELLSKGKKTYPHKDKFLSANEELFRVPAHLPESVSAELANAARMIFDTLKLGHYARVDFILSREKDLYFLGANPLPALSPRSMFAISLDSVAVKFGEFAEHIIKLAMSGK